MFHPFDRLQRWQQRIDDLQCRLAAALERKLGSMRERLDPLALRLRGASPRSELARRCLILDALGRRLGEAMERILNARGERLARAVQGLEARSPLATLTRGFAILRRVPTGQVVTDAGRLIPGDRVDTRLARDSLLLEVIEVVSED